MKVKDLKEGDRVLLFCPTAKNGTRVAATFEFITEDGARAVFSESRAQRIGKDEVVVVQMTSFAITQDGDLKDKHEKAIYIERRLHTYN